jgi:hypothetical protein
MDILHNDILLELFNTVVANDIPQLKQVCKRFNSLLRGYFTKDELSIISLIERGLYLQTTLKQYVHRGPEDWKLYNKLLKDVRHSLGGDAERRSIFGPKKTVRKDVSRLRLEYHFTYPCAYAHKAVKLIELNLKRLRS